MTTTTPAGHTLLHDDHHLTQGHLSLIDEALEREGWDGSFVKLLIDIPENLPPLPSALYGPDAGDEPIMDDDERVVWLRRGDREGKSKVVKLPPRPVRKMVVFAGPTRRGLAVYTAFGSQAFPRREPWDRSLIREPEHIQQEARSDLVHPPSP